jgi:lysophospholipase L1-like esterase
MLKFNKDERILFAGDSVTDAGRGQPVGEGLWAGVGTGYVRWIDTLLNVCYPELNLRITNMGCSGYTVLDLEKSWDESVMALNPDWLSVCIGANDVWRQFDSPGVKGSHVYPDVYEKTLDSLVAKTIKTVKGIVLMTPYYIENSREDIMRRKMDEYGAIVEKISEKYNTLFVDLQAEFDEYLKFRHSSYISWDRVHPSQNGNLTGCALIARAFLETVGFDRPFIKQ